MQINKNLKFIIFYFIIFLSFDSHTDEGFSISAVIETPQVEINGNADDPAIWFNEEDPSLSIVFGTDKYNGVYSYNLSGDGSTSNKACISSGYAVAKYLAR